MDSLYFSLTTSDITCFCILVVLIIAIHFENKIESNQKKVLSLLMTMEGIGVVADAISYVLIGNPEYVIWISLLNVIILSLNQFIMVVFSAYLIYFLRTKVYVSMVPMYPMTFAAGFTSIMIAVSAFGNGLIFYIDETGAFITGKFYALVILVPILIMAFDAILISSCKKHLTGREYWAFYAFIILPLLAMALDVTVISGLIAPSKTIATLLIYVNVCASNGEIGAIQEKNMIESRMNIMVSQIRPHFMYNSLNSIYYLVGKDKEKAKHALKNFEDYLLNNIDSFNSTEPIPFTEELEHIKAYLYLEKLRFEDYLLVNYEIESTDFYIPALSIQPLVENAVKHGIGEKENGGIVTIKVKKEGLHHEIYIIDNGVGFDMKNPVKTGNVDNKTVSTHIGLENVKERIEKEFGGTFEVDSIPNFGTTIKITVPVRWSKDEKGGNE